MNNDRQVPPRSRPGGRTAEHTNRIIEATIELLVEGGMPALTFQAVADRAGVARATMYRRWSSPALLAIEAIRTVAADQIVIRDTGTLHDDLVHVMRQIGRFIATPVGRAAIIAGLQIGTTGTSDPSPSWAQRWEDVAPIFQRAVQRGEVDAAVDAEVLFASLAGALYFRVQVMGHHVDTAWINRTIRAVLRHEAD